MRNRSKSFLFVVLCVLAVGSPRALCGDTYEEVSIGAGEEFTVALDYCVACGYEWELAGSLPSWLLLVDKTSVGPGPGVIGGGGTEYWTFRATAAGSATLTFEYRHLGDGSVAQSHVCRVTVEAPPDTEEISVAVGEEFTVALDYCVACGYEWDLAGSLPSWLLVVDKTSVGPGGGVVGGSGTEYWTFRATAAGTATLTFEYARPWEGTPAETHICQVTAKAMAYDEERFLAVGEEFTVALASSPSAGYGWSLAQSLPAWLEQVGETYVATNPGVIGGSGTEYWTFRATAAGNATLTFEYMRPWEGTPIATHTCHVTAGPREPARDGFETGDFSALPWIHQDTPWRISSIQPFSGRYCAQSGAIGDDGVSTLTCTLDCLAGEIGFAVRVSSEAGYDVLHFLVDGQKIDAWSGDQAWMQVTYPVSQGRHTFAWSYAKDKSKASGEDAAWIDEVTFPASVEPNNPCAVVLVKIPAGTFQMGDHDNFGSADEAPVHAVTLSAFQIAKYETTNAQYATYLNAAMADGRIQVVKGAVYAVADTALAQPYFDTFSASYYSQILYSQGRFSVLTRDANDMSNHPVLQVSWYGAKAFCDFYGYRLPTEAEWEYAARDGYYGPYYPHPWGSYTIDCTQANFWSDIYCNPMHLSSSPLTSPVGYYGPQGAYGLCDIIGNVWEYCQDWYGASYYGSSPADNPQGPDSGTTRVLRGSSWYQGSNRLSDRYWQAPSDRSKDVGFRVCR